MKHRLFGLFLMFFVISSCESDSVRTQNPYVPNYPFAFTINMDLPMYNQLLYPSNAVLVTLNGAGANGIIVFNAGGSYRAYEANCPNQTPSGCSRLQINGIRAVCPCDELEYSLFTGLPVSEGEYAMIPYRIEQNGNVLRIWN